MCQLRLGKALPQFVVSSACAPAGGIRGYWREVVQATQFLSTRFSMEYLSEVPRKRLYRDLVDVALPVPLYRSLYCLGPGQNVLQRVKRMAVPPCVKSFFFKLHTGVLPVKAWLEEKGLFVAWGVNCFLCKKPETVEHVFLECWDGVFFWDILQRTLKKDLPLDPHGIRYLAVVNDDNVPFDLVFLVGLHSIWKSRMAVRHAESDAKQVHEYFCEMMRQIVEVWRSQSCVPDWLPVLESVTHLSSF
uniref:Uncharacterized protein n=3 Tax=Ixodes ricinus TaxID=34613 RepID=V5H822_IXORI